MNPATTPLPAPVVTTHPRHVPLAGSTDPETLSWSTNSSTIFDSTSSQYGQSLNPSTPQLSSVHNGIHGKPLGQLPPKASMSTLQMPTVPDKEDFVSHHVPPLARQPKITYGKGGTIKSKDKMLNTDGDALYRFLLDNLDAPTFQLHCYGSHTVKETVRRGRELETKTRTVVDFDFVIDLALSMRSGPGRMYVLDDSTLAYRGAMTKEVGKPEMPQSVHAWARDYAASLKTGKEFRLRKAVVGLDRKKTLDAVNQIINTTKHRTEHSTYRKVYFTVTKSTIQVRADSALMTMLKDCLISCLLWLVCVFPIVWLVRRFGKNGGKWDMCRAEYVCDRDPRDTDGTPLGDGDWVKVWERTLRLAVGNGIRTSSPIYRPTADDSEVILFD